MTSIPPMRTTPHGPHNHACSLCARRKVRCDKSSPCSNCLKAHVQCSYEARAVYRPRKRAADEDLRTRLSLYEDLMRQNNIDFTQYANLWVASGLEAKLEQSEPPRSLPVSSPQTDPLRKPGANVVRCLWSNLSPELKHPPIQSLRHKDDPFWHPTPPLQSILDTASTQPELHKLQPGPRQIYQLWQIFVETVNPLVKIIHVPTLQPRVLDASWEPARASKPLTAIMFAIFTLAVTSISSEECLSTFGETRDILITRYRAACLRALIAACFLTTKDLEVLQALALFLLADPESELASTLTSVALRLGQKMGLNRKCSDPKMPFLEQEMRVRLWWQLYRLDIRVRPATPQIMKPPTSSEFGNIRMPLNVNDADLYPGVMEPPTEHNGPTEMVGLFVKYEIVNLLRTSATAARIWENLGQHGKMSIELANEALNELEVVYREKMFPKWDKRIPLHALAEAMAKLSVAGMRFVLHHPRGHSSDAFMTSEKNDMLFDAAVTSLDMIGVGRRSKYSSHLVNHIWDRSQMQMDAYIYVISELRRRYSGDQVALAWRLVEDLYNEHPELTDDVDNTFFVAFGDLTLEAWKERKNELLRGQGARETDVMPHFIQSLEEKRRSPNRETAQMTMSTYGDPDTSALEGLGLANGNDLDWEYWNDLLRL